MTKSTRQIKPIIYDTYEWSPIEKGRKSCGEYNLQRRAMTPIYKNSITRRIKFAFKVLKKVFCCKLFKKKINKIAVESHINILSEIILTISIDSGE